MRRRSRHTFRTTRFAWFASERDHLRLQQLAKLTVPVLKECCKLLGIKGKTTKADIIEQIVAHYSK
jgi:hypothetical protein